MDQDTVEAASAAEVLSTLGHLRCRTLRGTTKTRMFLSTDLVNLQNFKPSDRPFITQQGVTDLWHSHIADKMFSDCLVLMQVSHLISSLEDSFHQCKPETYIDPQHFPLNVIPSISWTCP